MASGVYKDNVYNGLSRTWWMNIEREDNAPPCCTSKPPDVSSSRRLDGKLCRMVDGWMGRRVRGCRGMLDIVHHTFLDSHKNYYIFQDALSFPRNRNILCQLH